MNAITTTIESAPLPTPAEWIDRGITLAEKRRAVDWAIADWMIEGRHAGYLTQTSFDFLGDKLGLAPRRLKDAIKAAEKFPPSLRATDLSVEFHVVAASLPPEEAMPLLKRASAEHLSINDCRAVVQQRRYETGVRFDDDDADTTLATLILRAWNRATPAAREIAYEQLLIAAENGFGIVDEDEVTDEQE